MSPSVGCRDVPLHDPVQQVRVPLALLYPADAPARLERFGPYTLELARDAEVAATRAVLVLISHGNGGSPWVYRGWASHLARAGFVVAMVEHPGNSRSDNALADTDANLTNRPRHVQLALDAALADPHIGPRLDPARVAVVGHSIGGFTALALAGGRAMNLPPHIVGERRARPDAEAIAQAYPIVTTHDSRVAAVALLAPAVGWLMAPGALADVRVPVLVRSGERDPICPPAMIAHALGSLPEPSRIDHAVVPGAGHFAFATPFPPEMVRPEFAPSQDPPGFDRAAYQAVLQDELVAFLRGALP